MVNAIRKVREEAKKRNKVGWDMHHTPEDMSEARARGERQLSIGSDQQLLMNGLKRLVGAVRQWQEEQD